MRISARCDYACRALLELSMRWPNKEPVQIQNISRNQNIPLRYLIQILIQLKRLGLVTSIRGKSGGYNLAKAPNQIKFGEVMRIVNGPLLPLADTVKRDESVFSVVWKQTEGAMARILDRITFGDIVNKAKENGVTNYQI